MTYHRPAVAASTPIYGGLVAEYPDVPSILGLLTVEATP